MRKLSQWILVGICVSATSVAHAQDTQADQDEAAGIRAADKNKGVDSAGNKLGQPEPPVKQPTALEKKAALGGGSGAPPRRRTRTASIAGNSSRPAMTRHYQADIINDPTFRRVMHTKNSAIIGKMKLLMVKYPTSFLEHKDELRQLEIMVKEDEHGRELYHDTTALYPDFDEEEEALAAKDVWPAFQMGDDKTDLPTIQPGGRLEADICQDPALCAHGSANGPVAAFEPIRIHLGFGIGPRGPEPIAPLIHTQPPPVGGLGHGQLSEFAQLFQFIGPLLAAIMRSNGGGGRGGYPVPFGGGFGGNLGGIRPIGRFPGPGGFGGRGGGPGFAPGIAGPAIPIYQPPLYGGGSIYNSNSVYGNVNNGGILGLQGQLGNQAMMGGIYPPPIAGRAT